MGRATSGSRRPRWLAGVFSLLQLQAISSDGADPVEFTSRAAASASPIYLYEEYEYDYTILDPHSAFGTPYGGWGRATRSRLEKLPLVLPPSESEHADEEEPLYMEARDGEGRLYTCRVYREDELEPESLEEGMFEPPRLRQITENNGDDNKESSEMEAAKSTRNLEDEDAEWENMADQVEWYHDELDRENILMPDVDVEIKRLPALAREAALADDREIVELTLTASADGINLKAVSPKSMLGILELNTRLGKLHGVCGHLHLGWWSYEWCFEQYVSQFHVSLDPQTHALQVSDFTKLGNYQSRQIITNLSNKPSNELASGVQELGRIVETYTDGDECSATGKQRSATVTILCCNANVMTDHLSKQNMRRIEEDTDIIDTIIYNVDEAEVCSYDVVICTTLLCADPASEEDMDESSTLQAGAHTLPRGQRRRPKENESIREILERTLGNVCLQAGTGGWWTYEFCHGNVIRQFHGEVATRKTSIGTVLTSHVVESEHILGKYPANGAESFPNEDEHKLVVNSTVAGRGSERGGNGAYFEMEYVNGDVCDESDVTERAIVAGGSGLGNKIHRASSVRYFCGSNFFVTVSEDSTCHYIIEVMVPDLCNHPFFKAPVSARQVIKCLPVTSYTDESDDEIDESFDSLADESPRFDEPV
jgi:hypothetical protein